MKKKQISLYTCSCPAHRAAAMFYKICFDHGRHERSCKICNPTQAMSGSVRKSVRHALIRKGMKKNDSTLKILGVASWKQVFRIIQKKISAFNVLFPGQKIKDNYVLDHIKPVAKFRPEDMHLCNHITNLQPLPADMNMRKGCQWSDEDDRFWTDVIIHNMRFFQIYLPGSFVCKGAKNSRSKPPL